MRDHFAEMFEGRPSPAEALKKLVTDGDPERDPTARKASSRSRKAKSSRALGHRLANKTIEYYEALGCLAVRCDYTTTGYGGASMTQDLLGFADVLVIAGWGTVLAQSTTKEQRTDHERKLCDYRMPRPRDGNKTTYELALGWLERGGRIDMVLWDKDAKGHWKPEVFEVTAEWLRARKEGLEKRRAA